MRRAYYLHAAGGTHYSIARHQLGALQDLAAEMGADAAPLLGQLGTPRMHKLQPVAARTLLAEVESLKPKLADVTVPGIQFGGANGETLGGLHGFPGRTDRMEGELVCLRVSDRGLLATVSTFPAPMGFRTLAGLESREFGCYFSAIDLGPEGWHGTRTAAMGGSGAPVPLPAPPVPSVTRWDYARVSGSPGVTAMHFVETPASLALREILHALEAVCNDSLRLKQPLHIRPD